MASEDRDKRKPNTGSTTTNDTALGGTIRRLSEQQVRRAVATHMQSPPPRVEQTRRGIHGRRVLPVIREGCETSIHSTSPRVMLFERPAYAHAASFAAPQDALPQVDVQMNTALTGPAQQHVGSNVGEPSTAISGKIVFYTGNWYAAFSVDGGVTFTYVDPYSLGSEGDAPGVEFCCDQVVQYIPQLDSFVW